MLPISSLWPTRRMSQAQIGRCAEENTYDTETLGPFACPSTGSPLAEHAELAQEAERLGYTDAWSLEVDGVDGFAPLAVFGLATGMRIGTAIANVFTRGPATLAMSAAGLRIGKITKRADIRNKSSSKMFSPIDRARTSI